MRERKKAISGVSQKNNRAGGGVFFPIVLLAFALPASVFSQTGSALRLRVAVQALSIDKVDSSYALAVKVAGDTAFRTLTSLGFYETEMWEDEKLDEPARRNKAEERRIDDLVQGRAFINSEGLFSLEMSVWSRADDQVILTETQSAESVFQVFDVAERIVASLVGAFSGTHIGFGTIVLNLAGEAGPFTAYLDGAVVGENLPKIEHVLNGIRSVEIRQRRLLGDRTIASGQVEVIEDEELILDFSIPYLMDDETAYQSGLNAKIEAAWYDPEETETVESTLETALNLFRGATCRADYIGEIRQYEARTAAFRLLKERRGLASLATKAAAGDPEGFDAENLLPESARYGEADNAAAFRQLCLIGATAAFAKRDAESVALFRDAAERSIHLIPAERHEADQDEYRYYLASLASVAGTQARQFWLGTGIASAAIGLAGGGFSAYAFATDLSGTIWKEVEALNQEYFNAVELSDISRLRRELTSATFRQNTAEISKWAGLALGGIGLPIGALIIGNELIRNRQEYVERSKYVADPLSKSVKDLADGGLSSGRILVMSLPSGLPLADKSDTIRRTPFVLESSDGENIDLRAVGTWFGDGRFSLKPETTQGLAVLRLAEPALKPAVAAITLSVVGGETQLRWSPVDDAGEYRIEVTGGTDAVGNAGSVDRYSTKETVYTLPPTGTVEPGAAVKIAAVDRYGFVGDSANVLLDDIGEASAGRVDGAATPANNLFRFGFGSGLMAYWAPVDEASLTDRALRELRTKVFLSGDALFRVAASVLVGGSVSYINEFQIPVAAGPCVMIEAAPVTHRIGSKIFYDRGGGYDSFFATAEYGMDIGRFFLSAAMIFWRDGPAGFGLALGSSF